MYKGRNPAGNRHPIDPGVRRDARDLVKAVLFYLLGTATKGSKALFVLVAANFYGAGALGLYFLAWSVIDILSKIALFGMDRSLIRDIARLNAEGSSEARQKILSIMYFDVRASLVLSLAVSVAIFCAGPLIAEKIFGDGNLVVPMRILAIALPFVVLTQLFIATTKGLRLMQYEVLVRQGIEPLVLLAGAILFIPFNLGAVGLASAHLVASLVAAASSFAAAFLKYGHLGRSARPLDRQTILATFRFAYPVAAMDLVNLSLARTDLILVGSIMTSASAGIYAIVVEITSVIKGVCLAIEPMFAPIVSELFHLGKHDRLKRNYSIVTRWLLTGSLLPVIAIIIFPREILALLGVHSAQAVSALIVLALAFGLYGTFSAAESLLTMTGRTLLNGALATVTLVVNCSVGYILIPKLGLVGAAIGTLTALTAVSTARLYFTHNRLRLLPIGSTLFWPVATVIITGAAFLVLRVWVPIETVLETVTVLSGMILVYAIIYLSGASEPEEKLMIAEIKNKIRQLTLANIARNK